MTYTKQQRLWCVVASVLGMNCAYAQTFPDAASLEQQSQQTVVEKSSDASLIPPEIGLSSSQRAPVTGAAAQYRFVLRGVEVHGNKQLTKEQFADVFTSFIGKRIGLNDLNALTVALTQRYRDYGHLLASVWLPPQKIDSGNVVLKVLEGTLDTTTINNPTGVKDSVLKRVASHGLQQGQGVTRKELDRTLMIMNELPGVSAAYTQLMPGSVAGSSNIVITTKAGKKYWGRAYVNNHNNYYASPIRTGITGGFNNITGYADQLSYHAEVGERDNYSASVAWDAPLGGSGLRVGISAKGSRYHLGENFAKLDANGDSQSAGVTTSYPLLRKPQHSIDLKTSADKHWYRDSANKSARTHTLSMFTIGVHGRHSDSKGLTFWDTTVSKGDVVLNDKSTREADAIVAKTAGSFARINANISRVHRVTDNLSLFASAHGQMANKNLAGSQKFSLGGTNGVRAYPTGEASGDNGILGRIDVRYNINPHWMVGAGYDAGRVKVHRNSYGAGDAYLNRQGAAVFINGKFSNFDVNASAAWRVDGKESKSAPERSPRIWLNAGYSF